MSKTKRLPSITAPPPPSKETTVNEAEEEKSKHALTVTIASAAAYEQALKANPVLPKANPVFLILEYAHNGELYKELSKRGHLTEKEAATYILSLTKALAYCHEKHVIHRDIKPENLLLDHEKSKDGGLDVIETYVFWNLHEPVRDQYNFEGRGDLVKFVKAVATAGLYVHLRIGPYACAE